MAAPVLNPARIRGLAGMVGDRDLRNQDGIVPERSEDHLVDVILAPGDALAQIAHARDSVEGLRRTGIIGAEDRVPVGKEANSSAVTVQFRAIIVQKFRRPLILTDLDISVIDELPAGRKPIKTVHFYENQRLRMFGFMKQEIALGRQVYVVYPLIKESEKLDLKNLEDGINVMSHEFPKPDYQLSIVHGKLKAAEKDYEMQRFIKGETHIMVATTVIEVGVNVPNASVMIIENAERFGLSQLHQLRGRVGRGAEQSYCILMSNHKLSHDGRKRLSTMVKTNNGFEIAEIDLELRGPGNIEGTEQSGVLDLKVANLATDQQLLIQVRKIVEGIFEADPQLVNPEHQILHHSLQSKEQGLSWDKIS